MYSFLCEGMAKTENDSLAICFAKHWEWNTELNLCSREEIDEGNIMAFQNSATFANSDSSVSNSSS